MRTKRKRGRGKVEAAGKFCKFYRQSARLVEVGTLLTPLGAQGQKIFWTLNIADRIDIAEVKKAFTQHFNPQAKTVFERFKFLSKLQKQGEPFKAL